MKILLIGKNGLLGSALAYMFGDERVGFEERIELIQFGHEELDITNREQVFERISAERPGVVLNAAGFTKVDDCETKRDLAMKVNGEAVGLLAEACEKIGAILVHYSTDYVFDGEKNGGYVETDEPRPLNVYGESKLLGERLLQENCKNFYLIRTSWLFGPHGHNFADTMVRLGEQFSREGKPLKVVNDQVGKPTFSVDLAAATFNLISGQVQFPFGIYHLVNESPTSWCDFAREIFAIKKLNVEVQAIASEELARPARRPRNSILLNTKFPLLRPHQEALKEYLER